jgi:hypothetical protein
MGIFRSKPVVFIGTLAFLLTIVFSQSAFGAEGSAQSPPKVGKKAPQFEAQGFISKALLGKKNLLLVFYRGFY